MNIRRVHAFLTAIAFAAWLAAPSEAIAQGGASFFEPFDRLAKSRWFVSSGWANGDHQSCLWHRNNVQTDSGKLRLSLTADAQQDHDFSCGEIQTQERYGYGTFEARMKVPYARGMNANFFTFIGAPQDRPHNEIDFEFIAPRQPTLQTNFHTANDSANEESLTIQDDQIFRKYAFIWEPDRIRWFIDGKLIHDVRGGILPNDPQKIYLSIWSTDLLIDWMGAFEQGSAPQTLEVDWSAYTKLGEKCAFEQSVLCRDTVGFSR